MGCGESESFEGENKTPLTWIFDSKEYHYRQNQFIPRKNQRITQSNSCIRRQNRRNKN